MRLRCDEHEHIGFGGYDSSWTCSQEAGAGDLALRRVCSESEGAVRGGSHSFWACTVTATAGTTSVALTCQDHATWGLTTLETESCASGPLSVTCTYSSAIDATRETCTARLDAHECRIVFLRNVGDSSEPGRVNGIDVERSGCG